MQAIGRLAKEFHFIGVDEDELPVISFEDATRICPPFAIHRTADHLSVRDGGAPAVSEPLGTVRPLTDYESDHMDSVSYRSLHFPGEPVSH